MIEFKSLPAPANWGDRLWPAESRRPSGKITPQRGSMIVASETATWQFLLEVGLPLRQSCSP